MFCQNIEENVEKSVDLVSVYYQAEQENLEANVKEDVVYDAPSPLQVFLV